MAKAHAKAVVESGHTEDKEPKIFTIEEANRSLVYLRKVMKDLMECYVRLVGIRKRINNPGPDDTREHLEAEYETLMDVLSDFVDEAHHMGVGLNDFERGVVHFPSEQVETGGEEKQVIFVWRFGEEVVAHWCFWDDSVNESFRPIKDLVLFKENKKKIPVS